jgi:hypothetical protein
MPKFIQTIVFGSAALLAVIATAPVTPAAAQGVPAGLLRLDSSQAAWNQAALNDAARFAEAQQQAKVRSAYARVRKNPPIR